MSENKQATLTPALLADMEMKAFMETCMGANVSVLKIIADMCEMGQAQLNQVFTDCHDLAMTYYDGRNATQEGENFSSLIQNITSIGATMGDLQAKREVALFYFEYKTPDCFKNSSIQKEAMSQENRYPKKPAHDETGWQPK